MFTAIVARRDVRDDYPASRLTAFTPVIEMIADYVKLEVRLTSDGVPVVLAVGVGLFFLRAGAGRTFSPLSLAASAL